MSLRPLMIVTGIGNGTGLGAEIAKRFSKGGFDVALMSRGEEPLRKLSEDINQKGGNATPFSLKSYNAHDIQTTLSSIWSHYSPTQSIFRAAAFNVGYPVFKPFLETTPEDVRKSLEINVESAFAFSKEVIPKFRESPVDEKTGGRGTLIFTGATAALRGNVMTSTFSAAKAGNRNLSQSLAKEFGREGIHVAHAIIDGRILNPSADFIGLKPESIAQAYFDLVHQEKSAWTWELDLRPADEKW